MQDSSIVRHNLNIAIGSKLSLQDRLCIFRAINHMRGSFRIGKYCTNWLKVRLRVILRLGLFCAALLS